MTVTNPSDSLSVPALATQLTVKELNSFADAESYQNAWNALVLKTGADIYQTFEWSRLWWQFYGTGRKLHLRLYFSNEELVGIVPGFVETLWLGTATIRTAKLVGADYTLHLCNLAVVPGALNAIIAEATRFFFQKRGCDVFLFGPISGAAGRIDEIAAAGQAQPELVQQVDVLGDSCNTYFNLPATFDEYLASVPKQPRGNYTRSVNQLTKAHKTSFDIISEPGQVEKEFEDFKVAHEVQWKAEGKLGHFGDWPKAAAFNRELVRTLGALGHVRFYRIVADDQVVSSQYCFAYGKTNYWRLPARVGGEQWDRLSFGRMGLVKMIQASMGEGLRTVEGGRGHYGYKVQMGGQEVPLRTVQFVRRGLLVSSRVKLFRASAKLLNIAYYKVLFIRLAPKVPALRRPLSPIYIRSTF